MIWPFLRLRRSRPLSFAALRRDPFVLRVALHVAALIAGALVMIALLSGTAGAQAAVYDPTNYAQNALQALRALQQLENQVRQLQNEATMLANQARNLARLDGDVVQNLRQTLATTERLLGEAEGVGFDPGGSVTTFRRLYPESYPTGTSAESLSQGARERLAAAREALATSVGMQSRIAAGLTQDEAALADLVGRSQAAEGALQGIQATNQLLALLAAQMMQGARLQITQDRATALDSAERLAAAEAGRATWRRFQGERAGQTAVAGR